jgi:hypothetical protein
MTVQRRALDPATNLRNQSYESAARGTKIYALQPRATRELLRLDGSVDSHVIGFLFVLLFIHFISIVLLNCGM